MYGPLIQGFTSNAPIFGRKGINVPPIDVATCTSDLLNGKYGNDFRVYPSCSLVLFKTVTDNYNTNYNQNINFGLNLLKKGGSNELIKGVKLPEDDSKKDADNDDSKKDDDKGDGKDVKKEESKKDDKKGDNKVIEKKPDEKVVKKDDKK